MKKTLTAPLPTPSDRDGRTAADFPTEYAAAKSQYNSDNSAPATEAPAATEEVTATDAGDIEKKGCGSAIGCGTLAAAVFAAVCLRKKEN